MAERFVGLANRLAPSDSWEPVTASVIDSTYHYARLRDLNADDYLDHSFFIIRFTYVVGDRTFEDKFEQPEPLEPGYTMEIFYDSNNPSRNTLQKPKHGIAYWLFVGIVGLCIGLLLIFLENRLHIPPGFDF